MSTATIPFVPLTPSRGVLDGVREIFRTIGHVSLIALGFTIALSTSGAELLVATIGICWLLSGEFVNVAGELRRNRVAACCLAMFGLLLVGATYGPSSSHHVIKALLKYREFLYVPLFLSGFAEERVRLWGLRAFLAGVAVMVGLSYAEWIFQVDIGHLSATDFVIYKDRISHSLLVAFALYVVAHHACDEQAFRWLRLACLPIGLFNILFLIQGRTGHVVVSLLFMVFAWQRLGWKGLAVGLVSLVGFWGLVYKFSPMVQERVRFTMVQINDTFGDVKKRNDDARLEFYEHSLKIIAQNPLLGRGTGGFLHAYHEIALANRVPPTEDPHSEYLLLAVQLGVMGPVGLLALFGATWWASFRLTATDRHLAQGLVMALAAGCLVNSLMYGFTGGLLFGYFGAMAFVGLGVKREEQVTVTPTSRPSALAA